MSDASASLSPFKNKTFVKLFAAQVTSLIGSGFTQVALALLAFDLMGAQAAVVLGIVWSVRVLAFVIFAPVFGGMAHKLPRKQWLIALDVGRAALVLGLFWVEELWLLYLIIFLINILSSGFTPVFQAVLPDLLPDEKVYTRALAYSRLVYEVERVLSPALAGLALLFLSFNALFVLNALCFAASAGLLSLTMVPATVIGERVGGIWHNIAFGIKGYLLTPRLRGLLALHLVISAAGSIVIVNTVGYVQGELGLTEQATVSVMAASGIGAIIAARITPRLLEHYISDRGLVLSAGLAMLLCILPMVLISPNIILISLMWAGIGFTASIIMTTSGRLVTRSCRKADRSAFFSANFALSHLMWLICYPLAGWLGADSTASAATGLSLLGALALIMALYLWPQNDSERLKHHHDEMDHKHPHYHDEHHQHEHEGWEGDEPHVHPHHHEKMEHRHRFVIDEHHARWPRITD